MLKLKNKMLASVFGATMAMCLGSALPALANSDPLPNDSVAPPVNVNILGFYNQFENDSVDTPVRGDDENHTHVALDATTLRYIRSFDLGGFTAGVQAYDSFIGFLGQQKTGGADDTSHNGFAQPNLSFFIFPVNDPKTGTYVVLSPWVSPPISSYNKKYTLNPTAGSPGDAWYEEMEVGARTIVMGTPKTPNLALEGWSTTTLWQPNTHYQVSAGPLGNLPATYRQQTTEELRGYVIYGIAPQLGASIAGGFYQSFGGKQTVKIPGLIRYGINPLVDSGQRYDESQLRLVGTMFLSPTIEATAFAYYDVAAHGGTKERTIGLRIFKLF